MPINLRRVKKASDDLSARLDDIAAGEVKREGLRKQRDDLNEEITRETQKLSAAKTALDVAVDELTKAMSE
jgi:predicted  nucleic acid-binding Zn-ribbon protein